MIHVLTVPLAISILALGGGESPAVATPVPVEASAPMPPVAPAFALTALVDKPELRLGEPCAVKVQFQREIDDWSPFLTRFDPAAYRCVSVWADEQWLWIKEEYETPIAHVFARRGTFAEALLSAARPHDRYELDLVVREMHAGQAWMEVVGARWTDEQTPEGTILHVIRALEMVEREGWALAISELDRALRPDLPGHVRRELLTIRERCVAASPPPR